MALDQRKFDMPLTHSLRDTRPFMARMNDDLQDSKNASIILGIVGIVLLLAEIIAPFADIIFILCLLYFIWLKTRRQALEFRLPAWSKMKDPSMRSGKAEGILYMGTRKDGSSYWADEEIWFTNNDIRTHMLYLGTTGAGKTEGLKSFVSNALSWGSGFVFIDGKADTDLWSTLSARVRRFGRDDDLFVLNYMTGNKDGRAPSNSLNPFASGSASYLTNMLVSLMPVADGDNAMWKERAVSLLSSLMPILTYMRDNLDAPLSVSTIRNYLGLSEIIRLSRLDSVPTRLAESLKGYLDTLPGYVEEAFDDHGKPKPMSPGSPMVDVQVPQQQHGYLSMQFTRSLQSLGDDYGYIFDTDNADVDMIDVVLNRRILVVLIPALEKSGDETANLGKIVAATLKGMMGGSLGATVEGDTSAVIENKPTYSNTPFMCVFDEVGYYTAEGMAVMAAQARSLGFSLVFAAQDLPAMEKRVKEEARSITANCNIKIFGKLEDPDQTTDFMEKVAGKAIVTEVSTFSRLPGSTSNSFFGGDSASKELRTRITGDSVRLFKEGEAALMFASKVVEMKVFYTDIGHAKAMRVQRLLGMDPINEKIIQHKTDLVKLRDRLAHPKWTARSATQDVTNSTELTALIDVANVEYSDLNPIEKACHKVAAFIEKFDPSAIDAARDRIENGYSDAQETIGSKQKFDGVEDGAHEDVSFNELLDDDEDTDQSSGGSDGGKSPYVGVYDPEEAANEAMASGKIVLPEGLSDEAAEIFKEAAKTLTTGLFAKPSSTPGMGGLPLGAVGKSTGGDA